MSDPIVLTGNKQEAYILSALRKIASSDNARPVLTSIHIDQEAGRVEVADGFCTLTVPYSAIEDVRPVTGNLPRLVKLEGNPHKRDGWTVRAESEEGTFPNIGVVAPITDPVFSITVNPKLLGELLIQLDRATSASSVRLDFHGETEPFEISTVADSDVPAYSVIMPMHDVEDGRYDPYRQEKDRRRAKTQQS